MTFISKYHEKTLFMHMPTKHTERSAPQRSLISYFVVRCQGKIIPNDISVTVTTSITIQADVFLTGRDTSEYENMSKQPL